MNLTHNSKLIGGGVLRRKKDQGTTKLFNGMMMMMIWNGMDLALNLTNFFAIIGMLSSVLGVKAPQRDIDANYFPAAEGRGQ